ncbi:jg10256, partial [Pararge aegeria aegeria]
KHLSDNDKRRKTITYPNETMRVRQCVRTLPVAPPISANPFKVAAVEAGQHRDVSTPSKTGGVNDRAAITETVLCAFGIRIGGSLFVCVQ